MLCLRVPYWWNSPVCIVSRDCRIETQLLYCVLLYYVLHLIIIIYYYIIILLYYYINLFYYFMILYFINCDGVNLYSYLSISNSYLCILGFAYAYVRIGTLSCLYLYLCCLLISTMRRMLMSFDFLIVLMHCLARSFTYVGACTFPCLNLYL